MKKFLSALLTVMLVMSASITVFGATKSDVEKKINSSFAFLSEDAGENGYTADKNLKDFYYATCSGADVSRFESSFKASVKAALEKGEITTVDTAVLVTGALLNMGVDVTAFEGFDLTKLIKETPVNTCANPYSLAYGIAVANTIDDSETEKIYAERLAGYYEAGKGTDFWNGYGTSADDLSIFIIGLAQSKNDYTALIDDALKLLETYYTEKGYTNYGANANSTALALGAYSVIGNKEKADSIYDMLIANFFNNETGGFHAEYDPYYATSDAVYGMAFYKLLADENKTPAQEEAVKPAHTKPDTAKSDNNTVKKNDSKKSPSTGASTVPAALFFAGIAVIASSRRKEK